MLLIKSSFAGVASATIFTLRWGSTGALTNRLGFLLTHIGSYFLVRFLIRDKSDVVRVIQTLAVVTLIIAPVMIVEHFTISNPLHALGCAPSPSIREGAIRAQGPFCLGAKRKGTLAVTKRPHAVALPALLIDPHRTLAACPVLLQL